ncbi:MAG: phage tail tape measure protein [Bacteroidales bacterium]|nr:phage tail tape measure protein [Bacteroidales bacterium]
MSKRAQVDVTINDEQAKARLEEIKNDLKQIRALRDKAAAEGDVRGFNQLDKEMKKLTREANRLQREVIDVNDVLNNLSGASINQLNGAMRRLNAEMRNMSRNDPGFAKKEKQAAKLRAELDRATGRARAHSNGLGKLADSFNRYFGMATAAVAAFTGIMFSVKEWVKGLAGMDDALANVMKTTGLTRKATRELYTEFRFLNTRTARKELLLLAEEAGRLGKKSKKDVMDFVEVGNQIQVALGDDLGGDAAESIKEVGKLTDIYRIGTKHGTDFRESMLKMGSAINEVSANSQTQAPFLIGMLKRMGGIADQADITAESVIGYAATLDILGQSQEISGTALNKTIINMFKDTSTYAGIAKMEVNEFRQLLQTDANEAFIRFLEGLNGNNEGLTVMAQKFDGLGLDGARAIQVLASLASNTQLVREQQLLANNALAEGTSLTNEYNIKNNNMAGNLEKIGRAMHAWFVNSDVNQALEGIVGWFAKLVKVPVEEKFINERRAVASMVGKLTDANTKSGERLTILKELEKISPDIVKGIDAEKLSYEQLQSNIEKYNTSLVRRMMLAKLNEQEMEIAAKSADYEIKKLEKEEEIREAIYKINTDIAASEGDIESKIKQTIAFLEKQGASVDAIGKGIEVGKGGFLIDSRSEEQKLLERIVGLDNQRFLILNEQNKIESDLKPIQEKIKKASELLALTEETTKSAGGDNDNPNPVIPGKTNAEVIADFVAQNKNAFELWKKQNDMYRKLQEDYVKANPNPDLFNPRPEDEEMPDLDASGFMGQLMQAQQLALKKQYADGLISQETYHKLSEDLEIGHLMTMLELRRQLGEDTTEIESQILDYRLQKQQENAEQQIQLNEQIVDTALSSAQQVSDAIFQIKQNQINAELDARLAAINRARDAELSNENLTEEQKKEINEKYRKKEAKIKLDAWKKERNAALAQAAINGALSITKTFAYYGFTPPGWVAAAAQAVATAAQIAVIASQKPPEFRKGGYTDQAASDDEPAGIVHANEFVATADATRNPTIRPVLDVIKYAQDAGTVRSINLPAVIQSRGFKAGGYTSATDQPGNAENMGLNNTQMIDAMNRFAAVVDRLQTDGVQGKWIYQDFKTMAEKEESAIAKTA